MGAVVRKIGSVFGLLIIAGAIFGRLMDAGVVPSDRVLAGPDIPEDQVATLLREGIIEQGEVIEYFYSEGLISVREGGSILTDRRVIAYEEDENEELYIYDIDTGDIAAVELIQQGDTLNYSVYTVTSTDEENWLDLWLPHEYGDGERFVAAVQAKISN